MQLETRHVEMVKVVANYFSTLATTVGSFVLIAVMISLVSAKSIVTIQGNVVNVTIIFLSTGVFISFVLLVLSCFVLSLLEEDEVVVDELD
jgi:hypothetical protein